jgi:sulfur-carrier protein
MNVEVRFFASLRESAGTPGLQVMLPDPAGYDELIDALRARLSAAAFAAVTGENVRVAVNQALTGVPVTLADGDEVAFLPPVTGG